MDNFSDAVQAIDAAWDRPDGLFANIRERQFDPEEAERILETLRSLSVDDSEVVSRTLVRLIWFIPLFLEWQTEAIAEKRDSIDAYREFTNCAFDEVNRILGMP